MYERTSNMNTSEEDENSILPEGKYRVRIIHVDDKVKTEKGDDRYNVTFEVLDDEFQGYKLWSNIMVYYKGSPSIKGQRITRHFLHQINQQYQGVLNVNVDDWVGQIVFVDVEHDEYKDSPKAKIVNY